jgi:hypothetical protein
MPRTFALLVAVAIPSVAALAIAAPAPKEKPLLYFPTRVGAEWVWVGDDGHTSTHTVTKVEDVQGAKDGAKLVTVKRSPFTTEVIRVSGDGLSEVGVKIKDRER